MDAVGEYLASRFPRSMQERASKNKATVDRYEGVRYVPGQEEKEKIRPKIITRPVRSFEVNDRDACVTHSMLLLQRSAQTSIRTAFYFFHNGDLEQAATNVNCVNHQCGIRREPTIVYDDITRSRQPTATQWVPVGRTLRHEPCTTWHGLDVVLLCPLNIYSFHGTV